MITKLMSKEEIKIELKKMVLKYCEVKGITEMEALRMIQAELRNTEEQNSKM